MQPVRTALAGQRWHFAHGPIELVIGADGSAHAVAAAHEAAWERFATVLQELVAELPLLRLPVARSVGGQCPLQGRVAQRMWQACAALPTDFVTPMAAVAGAVAQEIIAVYEPAGVQRAYVNNGGDIALHLAPGTAWHVGLVADIARHHSRHGAGLHNTGLDGAFTVHSTDPVRGIATSGWRGRSHSLGIADAVTVLATTAARADAAATVIANAVNVQDPRVARAPACSLRDNSDLGERLVTVQVPALPADTVAAALHSGGRCAMELQKAGLIYAAALLCQGQALRIEPSRHALLQAA